MAFKWTFLMVNLFHVEQCEGNLFRKTDIRGPCFSKCSVYIGGQSEPLEQAQYSKSYLFLVMQNQGENVPEMVKMFLCDDLT